MKRSNNTITDSTLTSERLLRRF